MPTSPPYWGHLPPPGRSRDSADYGQADETRNSLGQQPMTNRASIQTTHTATSTESTQSLFASPAASFDTPVLAPPPTSLPHGLGLYPPELLDKRNRRVALNQTEPSRQSARATTSAAPDISRAPLSNYRPSGSSGGSYTHTAGQPGQLSSAPISSAPTTLAYSGDFAMESGTFYDDATPRSERLDRVRQRFDEEIQKRQAIQSSEGVGEGDLGRTSSVQRPSKGSDRYKAIIENLPSAERKQSLETGARRTAWADDLSPLQKLELTLDSITKEEKRARVEAAEQRARERAAAVSATQHGNTDRNPAQPSRPAGHQVRFRDRKPSVSKGAQEQRKVSGPVNTSTAPGPRNEPPGQQFPVGDIIDSVDLIGSHVPSAETGDVSNSDLPKRNLSFRERAAKSKEETLQLVDRALPAESSGFSLTRSGSNKLKKPPPGDPGVRLRETIQRPSQPQVADDADAYDYPSDDINRSGWRGETNLEFVSPGPSARPLPEPPIKPQAPPATAERVKRVAFPAEEAGHHAPAEPDPDLRGHHARHYFHRDTSQPGQSAYKAPKYLSEWKTGPVGTLSAALLDVTAEVPKPVKSSKSSRTSKTEASDETKQAPTKFDPPLSLECGPLLRYCGMRREKMPMPSRTSDSEREVWRGSVMIVTKDSESSYQPAPVLRLFVQPIELLPPPPAELRGELPDAYVDPIAGIPKLGRRGETLYVRPVEQLEEAKDASVQGPEDGLFEATRSAPYFDKTPDPPGSYTSRKKRIQTDGERLGKYKDVRGHRLHAERGHTFWRFNIEIELRGRQQRIAYRINRGPSIGFWVPAQGEPMNIMFQSCNGFSLNVQPDDLSGPDPLWRDVLNNHQTRPFHVMIGGGDQIYNDAVMKETKLFQEWLLIKNPLHKHNAPFTAEIQDELESFYLEYYSAWFSRGLFSLANAQIPMVNMWDDHDIIDGFGSYPDHFQKSPVFSGLGDVAFKYYMLFQHQSLPVETEESEPSWALGCEPGPYIRELSRSLYLSLGSGLALLAVDARTERTRDEVMREDTWDRLMDRCYSEVVKGTTKHLLVLLGVPVAYPRLVWLENILTSRLMDPVKALGKAGILGKGLLNNFDGGVEVLDDLDDHWTAKNHKDERRFVIEDLQDLAADKSVRITILSGDVHLAAVGQFYSNPKLNVAKDKDFRYMPNIISSAIVNTPPPDMVADVLNKRNKVHHFDKETDEDMIPLFTTGVDGKPRNNKRLLPHRNWCSIREYEPGSTPPPTPPLDDHEYSPERAPPGSRGGLLRRLSLSKNRSDYRLEDSDEKDRSRPPVSGSGGFLRSLSRRASSSNFARRMSGDGPRKLTRTASLGSKPRSGFLARHFSGRRPDDGGINGSWGADSEDDVREASSSKRRTEPSYGNPDKLVRMGIRGGAGDPRDAEFLPGDDSYFMARPPRRAVTQPASSSAAAAKYTPRSADLTTATPEARRPFHRTPTSLSAKQLKKGGLGRHEVNLEGGLDITLNVEVDAKDPAGITAPYRLLVPALDYVYQGEDPSESQLGSEAGDAGIEGSSGRRRQSTGGGGSGGGIKQWFSKNKGSQPSQGHHQPSGSAPQPSAPQTPQAQRQPSAAARRRGKLSGDDDDDLNWQKVGHDADEGVSYYRDRH